ncbi:MAG: hypothetical protein R3A48_02355 [Polyangiales bacterium]
MRLGPILGAAALAACASFAWRAARAVYPDEALHARVAAAVTLALASAVIGLNVLDALGAFNLVGGAAWWGAVALGSRALPARRGGDDLATLSRWTRAQLAHPVDAALRLSAVGLVAWRVARGLATPPLAWDSLTYHLARPARLVQRGRDVVEALPDQWGYLEFFPRGGDAPWAWMLLWWRGDALLAPTGAAVLTAAAASAACLARALGADARRSGLAAALVAMIPAAANLSTSGYADVFVLCTALLAATFLVRLGARADARDATLALAALALGASAKLSGLPSFVLGVLVVAARFAAARARPRLPALAAALLGSAAILAPGYLRTWRATGSLTWPLPLTLLGRTISRGNEELTLLYAGALHPRTPGEGSLARVLHALIDPKPEFPHELLDWGPAVLLVLPMAAVALGRLWRLRAPRFGVAASLALAGLPFAALFAPSFVTLRTIWITVLGRLVLPLPATLAVIAATLPGRAARAALWFALLVELSAAWPLELVEPVRAAMVDTLPVVVGALAASLAAVMLAARQRSAFPLTIGLLACAALFSGPLDAARARHRHAIYRAAAIPGTSGAFELHPLIPQFASASSIWRLLDDGAPHRVAVSLGWEGIGHNGYRYPLLGSALQNTLSYVPVTADGSVVDHRRADELRARADGAAWLRRIEQGEFEFLVLLHPYPMEREWVLSHPQRFTLAHRTADGLHELWRVRR